MAFGYHAIEVLYNAIIEGVCVRNVKEALNRLINLIENLGSNNEIKELFEDITGSTQGTIQTYQRQPPNEAEIIPINQDKSHNEEDCLVVAIEEVESEERPVDKPVFDANGEYVLADIDENGNYVLHIGYDVFDDPIPPVLPLNPVNYALIWQLKGQAKDMFVIPSEKILDEYDLDPAFVRRPNGDITPKVKGDNINTETGGFKDFFVSIAIKLGEVGEVAFNTIKKSIVGAVNENKLEKEIAIGTCLLWGGEISIAPPIFPAVVSTKINIAKGSARFINNEDPENPTSTTIIWEDQEEIPLTYLSVSPVTFLGFDSSGNITQNFTAFTPEQEREFVTLGLAYHPNLTNITSVDNFGNWGKDTLLQFADFMSGFGGRLKFSGQILPNGNNLLLDRSEFSVFGLGINYKNNKKNPHAKTIPAKTNALTGTLLANSTLITTTNSVPSDKYDKEGLGVLVDIPDGYYTTHRLYYEQSSDQLVLQYGQRTYNSQKKASMSWEQEDYITNPIAKNLILPTIMPIIKGCTDLTDPDCVKFVQVGIFGDRTFNKIQNFSQFAELIEAGDGLSNERQAISYYNSGGVLYADIAKEFNFIRDDISFQNSDSSINTVSGDFDNDSMIVDDKIIISGSTNNNGIFTVVSVSTLKIIVSETIEDESAGAEIKIETAGKGDITYIFNQKEFILNCTTGAGRNGRARVVLTAGSDEVPQLGYSYITRNGAILTLNYSTTKPTGSYAMVFKAFIPSIAYSVSKGFYNSRRWTEAKNVDGRGIIATILSKIRNFKPYESGLKATITIDTVPSPDSVDFTVNAGIIREIYEQNINSLILSVNGALVVNDFTTKYREIFDLNEITHDAKNQPLNNKYFQLICAVSLNANGYPDKLLINVPNGSYGSAKSAFDDIAKYSVTSFPKGFDSVYLLFAGVFKIQGGTQITNEAPAQGGVNNIDLTEVDVGGSSSGSGTAAVQQFSDNNFAVFNSVDDTKIVKVDASNITTGNTRTIIMADRDVDLDSPTFTDVSIINAPTLPNHATNKLYVDTLLDLKANDDEVVHLIGDESIAGNKTFTETIQAEHLIITDDADIADQLTVGNIVVDEAIGVIDFTGSGGAKIITTGFNTSLTFDADGTGNYNFEGSIKDDIDFYHSGEITLDYEDAGNSDYGKLNIRGLDSNIVGPHTTVYTSENTDHPIYHELNFNSDNITHSYGAYFNGTTGWTSSDVGSNLFVSKLSDKYQIKYKSGVPVGNTITWNSGITMDLTNGNVEFAGFTAMGAGNEPTATKVITGTSPSVGGSTNYTTGISATKIRAVSIIIITSSSQEIPPHYQFSSGFRYDWFINSDGTIAVLIYSGQTAVAGRPITITIKYVE